MPTQSPSDDKITEDMPDTPENRKKIRNEMNRILERSKAFALAVNELRMKMNLQPNEFVLSLVGMTDSAQQVWPGLWEISTEAWHRINPRKVKTKW